MLGSGGAELAEGALLKQEWVGARRCPSLGMALVGPKNGWSGCEVDGEVGGSGIECFLEVNASRMK